MKSFKLTIAEPCHENWNQMLPEEQGKFCLSCQKTVVDFSAMSDREVLNYFNNNTGNTCGRFNNDQLNKTLSVPKERSIGKWKYFWQILLPAVFAMHKADAQKVTGKPAICHTQPVKEEPIVTMGMVAMPRHQQEEKMVLVEGKVVDEQGNPLQGASVVVVGTKSGVATSSTGNFSIKMKQAQKLMIAYIAYENMSVATGDFIKMKGFKMGLKDGQVIMSGVEIVLKESANSGIMGDVVVITNCFGKRPVKEMKVEKASEKNMTIAGKVVDEKGSPLPYASIASADKKITTTTDSAGNFSIELKNDQSIDISYVGYENKCVATGDFVKMNGFKMGLKDGAVVMSGMEIPLKRATTGLTDVVVVSYGTVGKLTGMMGGVSIVSKSKFNLFKKKEPAQLSTSVKIYPNPINSGQNFKVELTVPKKDDYLFEIIDASGRLVQSKTIVMNNLKQTETIDGQSLQQAGIYIIHLTNGEKKNVFNGKLVVQ